MANRAKQQPNKQKTFASVVAGVNGKNDFFSLAECNIKRPNNMPNRRIPNTKEEYSFFIDVKSTNATNAEVLNAINVAGIVGANVRDDLWVIDFVCENEAAYNLAMQTTFIIEGKNRLWR